MNPLLDRVVVDRSAEAGFRRRALKKMPLEYIEILYGFQEGTSVYVCAFMPLKHEATTNNLTYSDAEVRDHVINASDNRLNMVGSIHSHPNVEDTIFSEGDLRDHLRKPRDLVMGICAIERKETDGKVRHKCQVTYWPGVLPMRVQYTNWAMRKGKKVR